MTGIPIDLSYMRWLTDCTGIIQHGSHSVPNRRLGYTTDDNARALIVAVKQYERTKAREDLNLALTYLSYMHYAQGPERTFRNVMSYQRVFMDANGTEDCLGRSLWGLGVAGSSEAPENIRLVARKLFNDGIVWVGGLTSPRARAYSMLGMQEHMKTEEAPGMEDKVVALGNTLLSGVKHYSDKDWAWYEPYLTYGNAILPMGMLVAGEITGRKQFLDAAKRTIDFLTEVLIVNDRLEIIGNDGWYQKGGKRAWNDQQTIDAGYTVCMYAKAYQVFGDPCYLTLARICSQWFYGRNRNSIWVYDPVTHGCYDAITPWGLNLNQGAESVICHLLAQISLQEVEMMTAPLHGAPIPRIEVTS